MSNRKMVQWMAVLVFLAALWMIFFAFLILFPSLITAHFSRDQLLNLRDSSRLIFPPLFTNPDSFWEILVRGTAALYGDARRHTALLVIHVANGRSVANNMDVLLLRLNSKNSDVKHSATLRFSETWLTEHLLDSSLQLPDQANRVMELSGKTMRGRTCFYINKKWCTDVTVLKKSCSAHLGTLFINCKPFYSPWEFSLFILVSFNIPPQACVTEVFQPLANQVTDMEK